MEDGDKDMVHGLAKGLAVISAFSADRPRMTSSEAASAAGITRAAARRSLLTLAALGYVRADGLHFSLSPKILNLGYTYLSGLKLPELLQPLLDAVSEETGESSSAAILEGGEVLYVARSAKRRLMAVDIGVGTRFPAFCTSLGRVLLAHEPKESLDLYFRTAILEKRTPATVVDEARLRGIVAETAEAGYALVDEELETGLRSLSVPCYDRAGRCVCAVNISVASARMSADDMRTLLLPVLRRQRDAADWL